MKHSTIIETLRSFNVITSVDDDGRCKAVKSSYQITWTLGRAGSDTAQDFKIILLNAGDSKTGRRIPCSTLPKLKRLLSEKE